MEQKKVERKILITNKLGIHARAAAKFVELTSKCGSKFIVKKGSKVVNGSSLLGLMTLAASKGTEIKVQCIGSNSEKDLNKLISLIKNNFGEEKPLSENTDKELVLKLSALIIASDGMITDVEKTTFKNIRNFLGEKEYKYKDIMSEGELDRDKILEQELKIMNLLPPIESIN